MPGRQVERGQALPDSLAPGAMTLNEKGQIGAQLQAQDREPPTGQRKPQSSFRATRVVAASELPAAETALDRNALGDPDVDARSGRSTRLQPPRGPDARSDSAAGTSAGPSTRRISPSSRKVEVQLSARSISWIDGLDLVIPVRPAAEHVQEQVELGRRRPGRRRSWRQ